jgi:hypothetical protein
MLGLRDSLFFALFSRELPGLGILLSLLDLFQEGVLLHLLLDQIDQFQSR